MVSTSNLTLYQTSPVDANSVCTVAVQAHGIGCSVTMDEEEPFWDNCNWACEDQTGWIANVCELLVELELLVSRSSILLKYSYAACCFFTNHSVCWVLSVAERAWSSTSWVPYCRESLRLLCVIRFVVGVCPVACCNQELSPTQEYFHLPVALYFSDCISVVCPPAPRSPSLQAQWHSPPGIWTGGEIRRLTSSKKMK